MSRIVVGTIGTRGDVQPCVAVAVALRAAGHEVTVATHVEHETAITSRGLAFRAVGGSIRAIAESELGREWLESGTSPTRYRRLFERLFVPLQQATLEQADAAVEGHDALVYYPLAVQFLYAAERRNLPAIAIPFYPWIPTRAMKPLFAPAWLPSIGFLNERLGRLVHSMILKPFEREHELYRARVGLPGLRGRAGTIHAFELGVPHVHVMSPRIVPPPADWPAWATITGFCFLDDAGYEPPPALAQFLAAGPPPVYVGFGSMTGRDPGALGALVMGALERAEVRAIVSRGWGGVEVASPSATTCVVDDVPHDWLFPRVSAVVHHGGIGTLAAGLRAGRPTVVVPFFGDQPYWAARVEELGVGPPAVPRSRLTVEALAAAIRKATTDAAILDRAAALGEEIRSENGVAATVSAIEAHLAAARK